MNESRARRLAAAAAALLTAGHFGVPSKQIAASTARMPDFKKLMLIAYDYAKYSSGDERRRLIQRWERDVNGQAR